MIQSRKISESKTVEHNDSGNVSVETTISVYLNGVHETETKVYQYDDSGRFVGHTVTLSQLIDKAAQDVYWAPVQQRIDRFLSRC